MRAMREAEELVLEIPEPRVLGAHGVFLLGVPPGGGEIVLCASAGASIGHSMPGNSHMPSVTSAAVAAEPADARMAAGPHEFYFGPEFSHESFALVEEDRIERALGGRQYRPQISP